MVWHDGIRKLQGGSAGARVNLDAIFTDGNRPEQTTRERIDAPD
jgi:hypothetical protein